MRAARAQDEWQKEIDAIPPEMRRTPAQQADLPPDPAPQLRQRMATLRADIEKRRQQAAVAAAARNTAAAVCIEASAQAAREVTRADTWAARAARDAVETRMLEPL